MSVVVFQDATTAARVIADLEVTAPIEGGAGAVKMGLAAPLADGRLVLSHRFQEVDLDWIVAYADDVGIEVFDELP